MCSKNKKRKEVIEIFVAAEAEYFRVGHIALRVADRVDFGSVEEFSEQRIDPQQHIRTDARHSHWAFKFMGHNMKVYKSSDKENTNSLPVVHRVISLLKHFLMGTYYGVSSKHLQSYLNEFAFRFMRRDSIGSMHESLLRACLFTLPFTNAELRL